MYACSSACGTDVCSCSQRLTRVSSSMHSTLPPWSRISLLNSELINSDSLDLQLVMATLSPPPVSLSCPRIYMRAGNSNSSLTIVYQVPYPLNRLPSPAHHYFKQEWKASETAREQACLLHIPGNLSLLPRAHMKGEKRKPSLWSWLMTSTHAPGHTWPHIGQCILLNKQKIGRCPLERWRFSS